jgi:hypothetical protein
MVGCNEAAFPGYQRSDRYMDYWLQSPGMQNQQACKMDEIISDKEATNDTSMENTRILV